MVFFGEASAQLYAGHAQQCQLGATWAIELKDTELAGPTGWSPGYDDLAFFLNAGNRDLPLDAIDHL